MPGVAGQRDLGLGHALGVGEHQPVRVPDGDGEQPGDRVEHHALGIGVQVDHRPGRVGGELGGVGRLGGLHRLRGGGVVRPGRAGAEHEGEGEQEGGGAVHRSTLRVPGCRR
ncbi:hypothetical protein GCM10023162_11930 [Klenkia terrae]